MTRPRLHHQRLLPLVAVALLAGSACGGKKAGDTGPYPGPCSADTDTGHDSTIDSRATFDYNAQQLVTQVNIDEDADGVVDSVTLYEYDANGAVSQIGYDASPLDGVAERGYRQTADAEGRVLVWEHYPDFAAPPSWRYTYIYDAGGNRLLTEYDQGADDVLDEVWTHVWNADHTRQTVQMDHGLDTIIDAVEVYTYTLDGLLSSFTRDNDNDGVDDSRTDYTYDAQGNRIGSTTDQDADGIIDQTLTRTFDGLGNVLDHLMQAASGDVYVLYGYDCW